MTLTKADILRTTRDPETVEIDGLGEILIRPLSEGEYHKAQSLILAGIQALTNLDDMQKKASGGLGGMDLKLDLGKITDGEFESACFVAACGMSVDKERWTVDEVKRITPPGTAQKIAQAVYRISGVEKQGEMIEMVSSFRSQPGGERDVSTPSGGSTPRKKTK